MYESVSNEFWEMLVLGGFLGGNLISPYLTLICEFLQIGNMSGAPQKNDIIFLPIFFWISKKSHKNFKTIDTENILPTPSLRVSW